MKSHPGPINLRNLNLHKRSIALRIDIPSKHPSTMLHQQVASRIFHRIGSEEGQLAFLYLRLKERGKSLIADTIVVGRVERRKEEEEKEVNKFQLGRL